MMKKKLICGILAALMACTFAGCGGGSGEKPKPVATATVANKTVEFYEVSGVNWKEIGTPRANMVRDGDYLYFSASKERQKNNNGNLYQVKLTKQTLSGLKEISKDVRGYYPMTKMGKDLCFVHNTEMAFYDGKEVHDTTIGRDNDAAFVASGNQNEIYQYHTGKIAIERAKIDNGKLVSGEMLVMLPKEYGRISGTVLVAEKNTVYFQFNSVMPNGGNMHRVEAYDTNGKMKYGIDISSANMKMIVTANYVLVPDKKDKVKIYNKKDGKEIGEFKLPKGITLISSCEAGNDSAIFVGDNQEKTFRMNIT